MVFVETDVGYGYFEMLREEVFDWYISSGSRSKEYVWRRV